MAISWSYNGSNTLAATMTGLVAGGNYEMDVDPYLGASSPTGAADGSGNLTLTISDITDPAGGGAGSGGATGEMFGAFISRIDGDLAATGCNVFSYGTASTTGDGLSVSWAYTGTVVSATFMSETGVTYRLYDWDGTEVTGTVTGDGTSKTLSFTVTSTKPRVSVTLATGSLTFAHNGIANRMFTVGTAGSGTSGNPGGAGVPSPTVAGVWEFLLCDLATDATLLDLTGYATATIVDKLSRPTSVVLNIPYDVPSLFTTAADGDPNLHKGTRTIKVKRNSVLVKHVRVHNLSWDDDENIGNIQVTGYDPMQQLSVRTCWDSTGHVADFTYPSPTTGAAMLADVIANSVTYEDEVVGGSTPAPLPLDYTGGTISSTVDLAAAFTDTPITIGDLITTLSATGVLDVVVTPVDTSTGASAGIIGQLQVVDRWGSDLTSTVHFDYGTGSYNVAKARRVDGIDTLCNRLIYELGPKVETQTDVWKGNITGTELTPVNLSTPWQADQLASRVKYGTWAVFRIYDAGNENASRPLFHELWKTESTFRVYGRDQIFLTPARGTGAVFGPYADYQVGDTVAINTAAPLLGAAVSAQPQRIYGFQVEIDADGLEQVSEFIVSADGL